MLWIALVVSCWGLSIYFSSELRFSLLIFFFNVKEEEEVGGREIERTGL